MKRQNEYIQKKDIKYVEIKICMHYNTCMNSINEKEKRKTFAQRHTDSMAWQYKRYIDHSIAETKIYRKGHVFNDHTFDKYAKQSFMNTDTVSAIFDVCLANRDKKIAVLNFASYKKPGGGFIDGAMAQEEALCYSSFLYNVLSTFQDVYAENCNNLNKGLYEDFALYSKDIVFVDRPNRRRCHCDIITCPAPNKTPFVKYQSFPEELNTQVFEQRMDFLKNVAEDNRADILILGAWGCGVFRQDAEEVATLFKKTFSKPTCVSEVIYAVPGNDRNANVFKTYF